MTDTPGTGENSVVDTVLTRPGRNGGRLLAGGRQGNRGGGRPSSAVLRWAQLRFPEARKAVREIITDRAHPQRLAAARLVLELAAKGEESVSLGRDAGAVAVLSTVLEVLERRYPFAASDLTRELVGRLGRLGYLRELHAVLEGPGSTPQSGAVEAGGAQSFGIRSRVEEAACGPSGT